MLNFVFACDSLNYDFRELPKWATCRKIWIVQTVGSYSVKYTSLFNNFDFNIDMDLTSSLWGCISISP